MDSKCESSLGFVVRLCLKKKEKVSQTNANSWTVRHFSLSHVGSPLFSAFQKDSHELCVTLMSFILRLSQLGVNKA